MTGFWITKEDISGLRSGADTPQHAAANLSALIESTEDLIWSVDLDYRLLTFNQAFRKNLESTIALQASVGMRAEDWLPPDRAALWSPMFDQALSGGPFRAEYVLFDGRTLELAFHPIQYDGRPTGISVFGKDITERKAAEARVKAQSERFQKVVENSDAGYFRIGMDGCFEDVNPAWLRMHGFIRKEDAIGLHFSAVQTPEQSAQAQEIVETLVLGEPVRSGEFSRLRRDGTIGYHSFSANPVLDGGRVTGIEGFLVDISDRKAAEQQKRHSEQQYRWLFNSMNEGVALHRLIRAAGAPENYILLEVNPRYEEIVGMKREQVVNRLATDVYGTPEAPYLKEYAAVVETATPLLLETYFPPMEKQFIISVAPMGGDLFATIFFDVTQQRKVEELYKLVSENAADVIWLWDPTKERCVYVSPSVRYLRGFAPDEILAQSMDQAMPPDTYRQIVAEQQCRLAAVESGDESARIRMQEVAFLHKDGTRVTTETVTKLLSDASGRVRHILVISRDITQRKRAEVALQRANESLVRAEAHYRLMFNSVSDAVFVHTFGEGGPPGHFVEVNDNACRYLGYTREELLQIGPHDITAPEERFKMKAIREILLAEGQDLFETTNIAKDGRRIPIEVNARLVHLDNSKAVISSVRDISERRKSEEAIRSLATAVEQAGETIVITALDGTIQYCNPAFEKITGYSREEAIGQNPRVLKSGKHDREFYERLWAAITQGKVWTGRLTNKKKDGSLYEEDATISPIRDESGNISGYVAIKRDVTEWRQLEDQLRQAQKLESIGQLAGGVAHDFNNLLTVINGYSDFLLDRLKEPGPLRSYAEAIRKAGQRAGSLTKQLLAFSRKQVIEPRVLDLNATIRDSAPMLQRLIGEDVALDTHLGDGLGQVMADPDQIHQVIMNLAVNARDAMPHGGKLDIETANADLDATDSRAMHPEAMPGPYVLMTVTDTGHGMEDAIRKRIFEPFFTTKEPGKGTGLGLSTVYGIIRQNGGWIDVWSEPGVGTSFQLFLPRIDASPLFEAIPNRTPSQGGGETILVVEDQKAVRLLADAALQRYGYRVLLASDAESPILVAQQYAGAIQLLLTDVVLPGMNGRQLAERMQALHPKLKVLFTSGYTSDVITRQGVLDQGLAFIAKPFSPDALAAKVRAVLGPAG
ncbi:MAG: PAS domain S-box protein [Bryobacteraceae bacterium]